MCRSSFFNCLKNSAQQFYFKTKRGHYLLAGYPWFGVRARDQFIALPGCTLAVGDDKTFEDVMHSSEKRYVTLCRAESSMKISEK